MAESRMVHARRNIKSGVILKVITPLTSFVTRTALIYSLGNVYLGLNGLFRFFSLRGSCKVIRLLSRAGIGSWCSWIILTYSLRVHVQPDLLSGPPAPPRPQSFFSSRSQASTSASYSSVHPTPRKKSFLKLSHRFSPPRLMMAGDRKTDRSEEFRKSSGGRLLRSAR